MASRSISRARASAAAIASVRPPPFSSASSPRTRACSADSSSRVIVEIAAGRVQRLGHRGALRPDGSRSRRAARWCGTRPTWPVRSRWRARRGAGGPRARRRRRHPPGADRLPLRRAVEDLGDLLEPALRVHACVAHALQLEPRRVALAQRLQQTLTVRLPELLALGDLGLQRPHLRRETRTGARHLPGRVRRRVRRVTVDRCVEPTPLLLLRAEPRLGNQPLVLRPLLGELAPEGGELLLGGGPLGGDLLERAALGRARPVGPPPRPRRSRPRPLRARPRPCGPWRSPERP